MICSTAHDASSIQWTSSRMHERVRRQCPVEEDRHDLVHALAPELGRERGGLRRVGQVEVERRTEQWEPRHAAPGSASRPCARSCSAISSGPAVSGSPSMSWISHQNGVYGVVASYGSHAIVKVGRSPASWRSSSISRLFPMPGSPTSSIKRPWPDVSASRSSVNAAISASRPTSGRFAMPVSTRRCAAPTANASTGWRFPLTWKGSSAVVSNGRAGAVEHRGGGEDLAGIGPRHEPGRQVHRVTHDRVGAAVSRVRRHRRRSARGARRCGR